ncbi:hypothetical protein GUJ93_ZPchr0013g34756 [Zizania palustris]|uniref:Uncharacterized protein n=1 Tax=Zizania palustris TaxID=103762 RepID=A0A8J5WZK3_ZIZPA|nr:hypothetical protein GUJ93_ZPchr0013g34756 [Zizania palustris]
MRVGLEQAQKRQCQALLEERLRQVAVESQAWCGLIRKNEAIVAGLRTKLDHVLQRAVASTTVEGSGESNLDTAAATTTNTQRSRGLNYRGLHHIVFASCLWVNDALEMLERMAHRDDYRIQL